MDNEIGANSTAGQRPEVNPPIPPGWPQNPNATAEMPPSWPQGNKDQLPPGWQDNQKGINQYSPDGQPRQGQQGSLLS